jgi:hypothetical protein
MENNNIEMKPEKQSISFLRNFIIVFVVFIVFLTLLVAGYLILLNAGAKKEIVSINTRFESDQSKESAVNEQLFSNSEFLQLQQKKAFLQARILMAEADSVNLSLNLRDSIAALEIHGVSVFSSHISQIGMSSVFRKADANAILQLFSRPFSVQESYATIKKESLLINIAPKDTIEANVPTTMPDTSAVESANFILLMDNNVKLFVYSEEDESIDKRILFAFDLKDRLRFLKAALKNILKFKVPEYQPYIKIRLPKEDVKIIYTAIATRAQVSIYI